MKNRNFGAILTLVLCIGLFVACVEINSALVTQESQGAFFSSVTGLVSFLLYSLLALAGVLSLTVGFWSPSVLDRFAQKLGPAWLRWLAVAGLLVVATWVYLFSPWQFILTGPWTQLVFAAGLAQLIFLLLAPRRIVPFGWGELSLTISIFLFPGIVNEARLLSGSSLASRAVTLVSYVAVLALAFILYHPLGEQVRARLLGMRARFGRMRWFVVTLFWLSPVLYHYAVGAETSVEYPDLRFIVLLISLWITAFLLCEHPDRLVSVNSLVVGLSALALASAVDRQLLWVVNYPFGLYWSEGNRLYDYSLVFGQHLYNHPSTIINPYSSPGRYGLWGVLFLVDGLSIWVHRLWNLILLIVPSLLFSVLITRKIQPIGLRYKIFLWIALFFIVLTPLHPPFMLASIIVAWFAFDESPVKRGVSLLVAGYYVAISRFTWAFAPAAMGALIDLLLYYPRRSGNWFRRLFPTIILAVLGMAPGVLMNFRFFRSTVQGESLTGQQPLLWYRLLPNDTLGPGVLLLVLLYTGPLLILLGWWMLSKYWKLDVWQALAVWGALAGFFGVGLVISTKIGGGGDLHNLDMYLVTLMLVVALGATYLSKSGEKREWSAWAVSLVVLLALLPVYPYTPLKAGAGEGMALADEATVQEVLSTIQAEVEIASQTGEVLFMDQRQLLTFGYVPAIPFVPEYEKKYMMDQAMANNAEYFQPYYRDLSNKRFSLIVTEILRRKLKSETGSRFGEENDAFVTWVSNPTLCFYEPVYTSKETGIMLLVPRSNPKDCDRYFE